ncbi:aldose epimerase family protein [Treponema pedis]|uniref:Aldose 1-epimerase n=1 Tax=Treponema pedis TaxID=409322 RepID=A0A7S6WND1_9SPIR|nr:aldose epimerase family protein [Treponema pedis]QOW59747.1 galactose mutarotase [Treponema pedis]
MKIITDEFGVLSNGEKILLFTVFNGKMFFSVTNYGCCITSIRLPSKNGGFDDVVLGYSSFPGYINNFPHFGSLIGRYAGRIANAEFSLGNIQYLLTPNDCGKHCLHGGYPPYDKMLYKPVTFKNRHEAGVKFFRISPNGEQGFPGNLKMEISYSLTPDNEIILRYKGVSDKTTPINFTNHTYFNLNPAGMQASGSYVSVLNHEVQIYSEQYLEVNKELIPTGNLVDVENTAYDFRKPRSLVSGVEELGGGFDNAWVIKKELDGQKSLAAIVREPVTKRTLRVYSSQPALIMYTGNFLADELGRNGDVYDKFAGLCLESQAFPDAVHHSGFPTSIVKAGELYSEETLWHFEF